MKDQLIGTYNSTLIQQYLSATKRDMEVGEFPRCTDELVSDMLVSYMSPHHELTKSQYLCAVALIYSMQGDTLQLASRKFVDAYLTQQHPWDVSMEEVSAIMLMIRYLDAGNSNHRRIEINIKNTLERVYNIVWKDFCLAAYVFDTTVTKTDPKKLYEWVRRCDQLPTSPSDLSIPDKEVVILCGPSSSGKSTFVKDAYHHNCDVFSLDGCRIRWYADPNEPINETTYNAAFEASCNDKEFQNKADALLEQMLCKLRDDPEEVVLVVDNMSLTSKSRKKIYDAVKRVGNITVTCILFQTPLQTIIDRNQSRGDRGMNTGIIINMYNSLTHPLVDVECDNIGTIYYHVGQ